MRTENQEVFSMMRITTVALFAFVAACKGAEARPQRTEPALQVSLATARRMQVSRTLSLTGTLAATQESDVAADVVGKVHSTHVERGDVVAKGAPIARVDVRAASLQASDARAQLEAARAQDAQNRLECGRSDVLWAKRVISDGERDRDRSRCEASAWSVRAAEARVALAQKSIGDGVIRAPFAGMIAERPVAAGEYVRADTRVATLLATDSLRLELTVPEADALAVAIGQSVRFQVSAIPDRSFEGTIRYLGPAVRRGTRDLLVEAVVPNADGRLRPGMFAVGAVDLGLEERVAIPRDSVRAEAGIAHVFVERNGRLDERVVRLGPEAGTNVVVLEGLSAGERVVAAPGPEVRDGRIVATTSAGGGR